MAALENLRIRYQSDNETNDFVLRVASAIVAKNLGFHARADWTEKVRDAGLVEYSISGEDRDAAETNYKRLMEKLDAPEQDKEENLMQYQVKYTDNTGDSFISIYNSEEDAEAAIAEDFETVKQSISDKGFEYHYGEFETDEGIATEIWACGNDDYASWTRLWDSN